jgi:ribosomal protein S12 methylthiotransferase
MPPVPAPTFVSLVHLGCARNLIDSELILGRLAEEGLVVTDDPASAHTVVLNTCSFIGPAEEESVGAIRSLLERKRRGQIERVVVAGCLVQRHRRSLQERFPGVDLFAEISDYRQLARSVRALASGQRVPRYLEGPLEREARREGGRLLATPRSYAYLRISHGCDHKCSFCTIPSIRGPHRSKPLADLLDEARELLGAGVRELVLVAEDSTAWGRDLGSELPALVESLAELEGLHWLRLMYAYPNRFPWGLAPLLREHPRVATYLDIPVQHASTPMLRAMRRHGSGEEVRRLLDRLREEVPGIELRTTFLLGFPGESEADAEEVVELVHRYDLARAGVFPWSPEPGTPGFELPGRVPEEVALERRERVLAARDEVLARRQAARVGQELLVLVDEADRGRGFAIARTEADAPEVDLLARIEASPAQAGDLVRVIVEGLDEEQNLVCRPCVTAGAGREP